MIKEQVRDRIEKLKKELNYYRYQYHVLNKDIVSQDIRDSLMRELQELEKDFPEFKTSDSPTQRIESAVLSFFKKVKHEVPQWSFNDAFNEKDIKEFDERLKRFLKDAGRDIRDIDYVSEVKIDGLHVVLTYKDGVLLQAATRGDGKVGEDIIHTVKTIESLPLKLEKPVDVIVEGEIYIGRKDFEKLNKERERKGESLFANPRNAAAGAVRQLDSKIARERHLDCFIYDLSAPEKEIPETQQKELEKLRELGFKVNQNHKPCKNIEEVIEFWKELEKLKEKEDYWIDGIVVKVNKREYQKVLGYTGKSPRWAIAFKWSGIEAATIVEDIVAQVGRTGKITPIAILRPVEISGTTVSRASLHNMDEIERLGVKIGDTVIVQKAGEIIPDVVKVLINLRTGREKSFSMPKNCPACSGKIVRPEEEVAHYCTNPKCDALKREFIYNFVSKRAFDIKGLGPQIIDRFLDEGLIQNAADIFILKEGDIAVLERFGEKSAQNLINAIEEKKRVELNRLLVALGIRFVGEETAVDIAHRFGSNKTDLGYYIKKFSETPLEEFKDIEGIGEKVAESLYKYFGNPKNIKFLNRLREIGIGILSQNVGTELKEKVFVFTGGLETISREEAKEKVRALGGDVSSSVSEKTGYVVLGANPGDKHGKAKNFGVKIISEKEFLEMTK